MSLEPFTVTMKEAKRLTGLGKDSIYKLMKTGQLYHTKISGRTLIGYDSIRALLGVNQTHIPTHNESVDRRRRRQTPVDAGSEGSC